jgi:hypothetical protein
LRNPLKGDVNVAGKVTLADVQSLISALADLSDWKFANGISDNDLLSIADLNGDHAISNANLQSLLDYVKAGGGSMAAVPEPAGFPLLAVGIAAVFSFWNRPRIRRGV